MYVYVHVCEVLRTAAGASGASLVFARGRPQDSLPAADLRSLRTGDAARHSMRSCFACACLAATATALRPTLALALRPQIDRVQRTRALIAQQQQGGLPAGWTSGFDQTNQATYYVNDQTGESQWEQPQSAPQWEQPAYYAQQGQGGYQQPQQHVQQDQQQGQVDDIARLLALSSEHADGSHPQEEHELYDPRSATQTYQEYEQTALALCLQVSTANSSRRTREQQ